ncbi:MAG: hypothetical protein AB7S70_14000 [Hyphomicrobium sp.]|uniref:hypothetical protein n=1 Tax=Hyphomicrobium sp. TaxID=82 RepID=UPI003D0DDBCF
MTTTPTSDQDDYITGIQEAADGEVQGEVLFLRLAAQAAPEHRHKLERLAALEVRTGREMDALVQRYGLTLDPANRAEAEERAKVYDGMGYYDILAEWATWIPDYVDLYDRLAERARAGDEPALSFLSAHERAIDTFIKLELAGRSAEAMAELDAVLDR